MNKNPVKNRYVAAVDLGSNSFHMLIAQEGDQGDTRVVDKVREMIRLGAGLDANGDLSEESQNRALDCLGRFRQRLDAIPAHRVRAVGTNTLRAAKNSREFLDLAESALGHPISVVSGHEEARLVYLGAAFDLATSGKQRLVVDIGGGSTELIVGKGYSPLQMDSLYIGCVSLTRRFFDNGEITASSLRMAERVVQRELEPVSALYRQLGWDEVVGTSGTIKAIDQLSRALGNSQDWIASHNMESIKDWLVDCGHVNNLDHISEQRRPVFPGGFAILATVFKEFGIPRMDISEGALREGVAYDLIGRLHDEDSRFRGVDALVKRFQPDLVQSARVQKLAINFFQQVREDWDLNRAIDRKLLIWACDLHEIGISIAYSQNQFHGGYIIENSNMDGFSRQVQRILSLLVRNHRQKINREQIETLAGDWPGRVMHLLVLLRLAIAFYRGRADADLSFIRLKAGNRKVTVKLPEIWAEDHPLTVFDLETEQGYFSSAKFKLRLKLV